MDFGCGVGRMTRAFARHFKECIGVDISEQMIANAKELNALIPQCHFIVNRFEDLRIFPENYFDMVYSGFVLQHIPRVQLIRSLISEFVRVLKKEGLLVFQLPSYIPLPNRIQPRRRLYALLRALGVDKRTLYYKLRLHPLCASFIPQEQVVNLLKALDADIIKVRTDPKYGSKVESRTYFITK